MFWRAVRFDGRKKLVKCPNRMKSTDYLEILQKFDEKLNIPGLIFQQDNAPIHKSQIVGQFFEQRRWNVLEWPPYSPDLNIIEKLWSVVKKKAGKTNNKLGETRNESAGNLGQYRPRTRRKPV